MVAAPIWYMSIILAPILNILDTFLNKFIKLLGIKSQERTITEEEIRGIIKAAEEEGSIKEIEKNMINSIFEFDDINVSEIATPRTDMAAIESKSRVEDAFKLILRKKFSRIPVYEKHKDNIVGIIYLKDILFHMQKRNKNLSVSKVMKNPYFVVARMA